MKLPVWWTVVIVAASCDRELQRRCEIAGGWELGSHDPTDRSTNAYIAERRTGALDLEQDVRRADGSHGWEAVHGRWRDATHIEFLVPPAATGGDFAASAGSAGAEQCEVAASCESIACSSFGLVHHFCDVAGDWRTTFARREGTARIATHRDDLEIELAGAHLEGLRVSARDVVLRSSDGDVRCTVSQRCDRIACTGGVSFELRR